MGFFRTLLLGFLGYLILKIVRGLKHQKPDESLKQKSADTKPSLEATACKICGSYTVSKCDRPECQLPPT